MRRKKLRLDELLLQLGLCETRSRARALILAGKVRRGTKVLDKPGKSYPADTELTLVQPTRFVGRGGEKLEAYLEAFAIPVAGKRILDVGASTGGFTDCLLQRGAAEATCVDVGRAQMHPRLLLDPRVTNMERINARHLTADQLPYPEYELAVMDLSFISLKKVLPAIWALLKPGGRLIALVKPQFEADKILVDKGRGVIQDEDVRLGILHDMQSWITSHLAGSSLEGYIESPLAGGDGNREYLLGVCKR